jgi:hypothetical protein
MTIRKLIRLVVPTALLLGLVTLGASTANAARLAFYLHCDKTTEHGEDEVFFVLTARKPDGEVISMRLPGDKSHWDMNDNANKKRDIAIPHLLDFDLKKDERMQVIVAIMEKDGGSPKQWLDFSKALADKLPANDITTSITSVLDLVTGWIGLVNVKDTDDYIGSFRVDLWNDEDSIHTIKANWSAVDRAIGVGQSSGPRSNGFRFDGDGTNYYGWGELYLGND